MPSNNGKNNHNDREKARPKSVQNNKKGAPTKKTRPATNGTNTRAEGGRKRPTNSSSNTRRQAGGKAGNVARKPSTAKANNAKTNTTKIENKKEGKQKKNKFSKRHPKLMLAIKIMIVLFLLVCVIGAGIVAGMFFGLFGDDFEITKEELKIGAANSVIVDSNGAVVANLSGDEKRKIITLEDMAEYLPKAYVAIEDERYYKHSGVDLKRTAGAIVHTVFGKSSYGGSTITQQLVKNITKDDESSGLEGIFRKVKEWAKAYQVERMISKDQILELYLNILFVGSSNLHGVELGAEYYFNKSAKDLDLAECAFMAGINSSPNSYDPFDETKDNTEKIKNKTKTVLNKMKELGYIENQEDYDAAVAKVEAGLPFQKGAIGTSSGYSYHTDAVIEQVISQVMEEKEISRELARNYVYSSGLTIYSTVDVDIQARVEEETLKDKYSKPGREKNPDGSLVNEHTEAAMVIIDHKTGNVLGVSGGLGQKTGATLNRATQTARQPGSSIKPIADIAPALQEKVITAATVYDDVLTDFNGYQPKNDGHVYRGLINIRDIIAYSQNVPEVKIMKELTPTKSIDYMRNFGVSTLYKQGDDPEGKKIDESLPIAIGGLSEGISPLEMAAAYATIANNGEYIEPTFYSKVVDSSGNTVLEPKQERRRVISEQNAYIVQSILQEPVKKGTATYCAISGMDVAAKTGTTDKSKDRWLCGFTPYYAAACWFGYNTPEEIVWSGTNPAGQIWDEVMTAIHKGLQSASFTRPSGLVEQTVCRATGCVATTGCMDTYKEIFTSDNLPEKCEGHGSQTICSESGMLATEFCSQYVEVTNSSFGGNVPKERLQLWKPVKGATSSAKGKVNEICNIHTKPKEVEKPKPNTNTTNTNKPDNNTNSSNTSNTSNNTTNTTNNTTNETNTGGGDSSKNNTTGETNITP
ncbi:MAG: hypothetical protein HFJ34_00720 [Clostridia bacterium]|nr:hypothetical protein [Clostridia bacterium]